MNETPKRHDFTKEEIADLAGVDPETLKEFNDVEGRRNILSLEGQHKTARQLIFDYQVQIARLYNVYYLFKKRWEHDPQIYGFIQSTDIYYKKQIEQFDLTDDLKKYYQDVLNNNQRKFLLQILEDYKKRAEIGEQAILFPNVRDPDIQFGMPRPFSDRYSLFLNPIEGLNLEPFYKTITTKDSHNQQLQLKFRDPANIIKTEKDFIDAVIHFQEPKTIQIFLSMWYLANKQGNFYFNDIRLNDIMELTSHFKSGYSDQRRRQDVTKRIYRMHDAEIYLDNTYITFDPKKNKKEKHTDREFFRILELDRVLYAHSRKTGKIDESVIVKFSGRFLPKLTFDMRRGQLISTGLLKLDANRDQQAIKLGLKLSVRFDQKKQRPINISRGELIRWAGYEKLDNMNITKANKSLANTLNKLKKVNCIGSYRPHKIPIDNSEMITIYPDKT